MNRCVVGTAVFLAVGSIACARASDNAHVRHKPAVPETPAPETFSWTGFYVGAGLGARISDTDWTTTCFGAACQTGGVNFFFVDGSSPRRFGEAAFRGSFFTGYNFQITDWVVGVEADIGLGNRTKMTFGIPGCTTFCGNLPPTHDDIDSASIRMQTDGSLRARAGYLLTPSVLVYGTAGLAWQRVKANLTCSFAGPWCFPPAATDIRSETHAATLNGWTVGAGLEWMIYRHWLLRGEYRYSDFGHIRSIFFSGTGDDVFTDIRVATHIMTFGAAYKF